MKKRAICSIFGLLFALIFVIGPAPAALAAVPDRPANKYVLDSAGVLSEDTEQRMISENQKLFRDCGGEIVIAAVDFLGGKDIEDYTYDMFKAWGVGSKERNNGLLLVLAIGEEDYYVQAGYGIDDYFDAAMLSGILEEDLEPDFAAGDYDAGVKKTFDSLLAEMVSYYGEGPGRDDPLPEQDYRYDGSGWEEDGGFSGGGLFRSLKTIAISIVRVIVIVAVILFVMSLFRGSGGSGPRGGGGGGGFWRGMWLGSMMGRRPRTYWGAPPPPPPRPGGFGGPPPRGGFGGFGGGPRGGFSGGGRSHGGGVGRSGGFHGGGGTHGGGAGRH